jgi:serine protease
MSSQPDGQRIHLPSADLPVSHHVVVKFNTGRSSTTDRGASRGSTPISEQDLRQLHETLSRTSVLDNATVDDPAVALPKVLDWTAISERCSGDDSVSFRPLNRHLDPEKLRQVHADGRNFADAIREEEQQLPSIEDSDDERPVRRGADDLSSQPELDAYYRIDLVNPDGDPQRLQELIELIAKSPHVDAVFISHDEITTTGPTVASTTMTRPQGYFNNSHEGLGIDTVQDRFPQANGEGIRLVDIEQGWFVTHPDLQLNGGTLLAGDNVAEAATGSGARLLGMHGLMVLGILAAKDNGAGIKGIVPKTEIGLSSERYLNAAGTGFNGDILSAIYEAYWWLRPGDVLLFENQFAPPSITVGGVPKTGTRVPVEIMWEVYDWIKALTQKGVIVIEPVGNNELGGISLDTVVLPSANGGGFPLFSGDSGSILVAAGRNQDANPSFTRLPSSNFSSYTDCFADGDLLWALDLPSTGAVPQNLQNLTSAQFKALFSKVGSGGTSSAAAIIAGAAVLLQSLARSKDRIISPTKMREILRHSTWNTRPQNFPGQGIGVMPDLVRILNETSNLDTVSVPWQWP